MNAVLPSADSLRIAAERFDGIASTWEVQEQNLVQTVSALANSIGPDLESSFEATIRSRNQLLGLGQTANRAVAEELRTLARYIDSVEAEYDELVAELSTRSNDLVKPLMLAGPISPAARLQDLEASVRDRMNTAASNVSKRAHDATTAKVPTSSADNPLQVIGEILGVAAFVAALVLLPEAAPEEIALFASVEGTGDAAVGGEVSLAALDEGESSLAATSEADIDDEGLLRGPGVDLGNGRDIGGRYTVKGNQIARMDAADKEELGVKLFEDTRGVNVIRTKTKSFVNGGNPNGRIFDGLFENSDGSYGALEVKSGTAARSPVQMLDTLFTIDNPGTTVLNGKSIVITSVDTVRVP